MRWLLALLAVVAGVALVAALATGEERTDDVRVVAEQAELAALAAHQAAEEAQKALVALCALRADLDKRIASSERFLRKNPEGIPGIPASVIRQGLENSRRTRAALEILNCEKRGLR